MSLAKLLTSLLIFTISCAEKEPVKKPLNERLDDKTSHQVIDLTQVNQDSMLTPSFSVSNINGDQIMLEDYRGKIILLNFWGIWCAPCIAEIPYFVELQSEFPDDIQFIGISSIPENRDKVIEFAKQKNVNYPLIVDDGYLKDKFHPTAWPSTYIISKTGQPIKYIIGATNKSLLRKELELLIN